MTLETTAAPDSMRCSYQMMPRQYSSRASSSSWIHSMGPEKIDPRIPLEEQLLVIVVDSNYANFCCVQHTGDNGNDDWSDNNDIGDDDDDDGNH